MKQIPVRVDMGMLAVFPLDDGESVLEVPGIAVAVSISCAAFRRQVEVPALAVPDGAATFLEVAAPIVVTRVEALSGLEDMEPPVLGMHCGPAFVESKGLRITLRVGGLAVRRDVVTAGGVEHWRKARSVKLQHLEEPGAVRRPVLKDVVGPVIGDTVILPPSHHTAAGLRILHPLHRALSK